MSDPTYLGDLERLKQLDESERSAFLDLLVLAILADAKITDEELEQMDKELLLLPFLEDPEVKEKANLRIAKTKRNLRANIHDHDYVNSFVHELSFHLIDPAHRMIALRMFVSITMADGTTELERTRCEFLADCFGWPVSKVDEIQNQILAQ